MKTLFPKGYKLRESSLNIGNISDSISVYSEEDKLDFLAEIQKLVNKYDASTPNSSSINNSEEENEKVETEEGEEKEKIETEEGEEKEKVETEEGEEKEKVETEEGEVKEKEGNKDSEKEENERKIKKSMIIKKKKMKRKIVKKKKIRKEEEEKEEICSVKECDKDDDFVAIEFYEYDTIQCIKIIREICFDSFTKVFEVSLNDEKKYAMKQLRKDKVTFPNLKKLMTEFDYLKYLDHPGFVQPYGIYLSDENTPHFFTFDSIQMNLSSFIRRQESLAPEKARKILYQVADSMKYCHEKKVIHGNLNPSQILISSYEKVKILGIVNDDFIYDQEQSIFTAPEILNNDHYNEKIDVYSFGFLVYFVMNDGKLPEISNKDILSWKRPDIPEKFDTFSQELIVSCLKSDPNERPSFSDICNLFTENF